MTESEHAYLSVGDARIPVEVGIWNRAAYFNYKLVFQGASPTPDPSPIFVRTSGSPGFAALYTGVNAVMYDAGVVEQDLITYSWERICVAPVPPSLNERRALMVTLIKARYGDDARLFATEFHTRVLTLPKDILAGFALVLIGRIANQQPFTHVFDIGRPPQ